MIAVPPPAGAVKLIDSAGSISIQGAPSLPTRVGCPVIVAFLRFPLAVGTSWAVSRLGVKSLPIGPAPAKIIPPTPGLSVLPPNRLLHVPPPLHRPPPPPPRTLRHYRP